MSGLPRSLEQLDKELLALGDEAMVLDELDGFIAGVLVCPELIRPGEWLPFICSQDGDDNGPAFDDADHANRVFALVMTHYNNVARTLLEEPDSYTPLFTLDRRNGDIVWEAWIDGFERALALRPLAWEELLDADADTSAAIRGMLTLVEVANGDRAEEGREAINASIPDYIAHSIVTLNEWRLANSSPSEDAETGPVQSAVPREKIGPDDPCPCGSGKKYKRCCGMN